MKALDVLNGVLSQSSSLPPETEIEGLAIDSRLCGGGDLFFARRGYSLNGENFVPDAIKAGAVGIVAERDFPKLPTVVTGDVREALAIAAGNFYSHPDRSLNLIGITGTNGKTTTAWFLRHILQHHGGCGLLSTVEVFDGKNGTPAVLTTPEAHEIHRILSAVRNNHCEHCVMEVSAHAVSLKRVFGLMFKVAVFTNLSRDHLDFYGDMKRYFAAKKEFFEMLSPDAVAVINVDDTSGKQLAEMLRCHVISVSPAGKPADISVKDVCSGVSGIMVRLTARGKEMTVELPISGLHNAANLASAAGVLMALEADMNVLLPSLDSVRPVPGRMESIPSGDNVHYFVDFAHTPDGLRKVLSSPDIHGPGRVICVFGCGGDRDRGKRPRMMRAVCENADIVIATADNPRSESQEQIFRDMKAGETADQDVLYISNRKKAIRTAVSLAEPGDVVIVAGKGHEPYQLIKGEKIPFSDAGEIRQALKEAGREG